MKILGTRTEILHFEKSEILRKLQLLCTTPNPVVVLPHTANAVLDRSGDLRSGRTIVYSEKPSSMVTACCDVVNQVFLAMHYDRLQGPFYISAFSICKQKQQHCSWRNYTMSALPTVAQGSQHTIDYAYGIN